MGWCRTECILTRGLTVLQIYPYASGSFYTASFAISSSFATTAQDIDYVFTASIADTVINPTSGSPALINICLITYEQYLALLETPGNYENCTF